ncbi:MAG: type II secretion system protein GspC [Candidatus Deferrimicrobiaceae bacterium]|jgi:type II secretion system protein C
MQKSAFYAIVGTSLLVTAVSLGYSASRYFSTRYYAPPPPPSVGEVTNPVGGKPDLLPERWTNIFAPASGMNIPSRFPGQIAGPAPTSTSSYILLGTISSDLPTARRAILWAEGMKDPLLVREHAEIEPGVQVASIERDHVWIARGPSREKLDLLPVGSGTRKVSAPAPAPKPVTERSSRTATPAASTINVNKIDENTYSLDEATVTELSGDINKFMTQVRIIPYFEANKSAGYRLAAMRPGSTFAQLGFRGGDIIQRVNDVELTSPEKMYTIFQNLKDEKVVTVDILRQGKKNTLTYEIR